MSDASIPTDAFPEVLSDARNEPPPSVAAVLGSPQDPDSIPVNPPAGSPPPPLGQLLPDVQMAELDTPNGIHLSNGVNGGGVHSDIDSPMVEAHPEVDVKPNGINGHHDGAKPLSRSELPLPSSVSAPTVPISEHVPITSSASYPGTVDPSAFAPSAVRPAPDSMDDDQPPAKRARKLSNAEQASLAHTNGFSATSSTATLSGAQFRFALSTVRALKKQKDAAPFLVPVDPVALNIPHYPTIVKHPMDFSTVERKLNSSNPAKPDPNPENPRYRTADEFIADVKLIFDNCYTFNGHEHLVSQMGKRVEGIFDKQLKHMPPNEEPKPPPVKKASPPPPPPPAPVVPAAIPKKAAARRPSTTANAVPTIRRSESENQRPKREIHPPAPKDLPYADVPKRTRPKKVKDDGTNEQLKYCNKLLTELHRKQYWAIASPFYDPVDWQKMELWSYPKIVKKPMDLGTMRRKIDKGEYPDATKFHSDFKLMIRNCFAFNPVNTPVNLAGIELQKIFDEKWAQLPPLHDISDDEDEEDSDEEDSSTVAMLTAQLEVVKGNLDALKKKKKKNKDTKQSSKYGAYPHAGSSKVGGASKSKSSKKTKGKGKALLDDEVLSFDQKKDLSETIQTLDGPKLERVIQIIHEGVPEIRDSTEEIELDIDSLPASVLLKLYNFVLRPIRPKQGKSGRHSSGTGTGGVKRKSMDEEAEAERIRLLEERIRLFDKEQGAAAGDDSGQSSDSSDSDSSGSDSE